PVGLADLLPIVSHADALDGPQRHVSKRAIGSPGILARLPCRSSHTQRRGLYRGCHFYVLFESAKTLPQGRVFLQVSQPLSKLRLLTILCFGILEQGRLIGGPMRISQANQSSTSCAGSRWRRVAVGRHIGEGAVIALHLTAKSFEI